MFGFRISLRGAGGLVPAGLFLGLAVLAGCDILFGDNSDNTQKMHGLDFGPFVDGSDPTTGAQVRRNTLLDLSSRISGHTEWLRTYGVTGGLEAQPEVARELGLKIAVGAWLGRDPAANEREITGLINLATEGKVDLAVVGSEALLREDLTQGQIVAHLERVRQELPAGIPVTTAEPCDLLLRQPDLLSAVDIVFFNYYAYFEGHDVSCAISGLHSCYLRLKEAAPGKPIMVSETGWPTCGDTIAKAVPSVENASHYLVNFLSWARATGIPYFYFEAYDEPWKARQEGPQGPCWGIWTSGGSMKKGMRSGFSGRTVKDNWSDLAVPGGPGTATIEFTSVPEYGSFDDLEGIVLHVRPTDYRVAVYIYVRGWWTKPYFNRPTTAIGCDGSWRTDVTTGGIDERATRFAAFLLPYDYEPPLSGGRATLPAELQENAVASVEVARGTS